MFKLKNSFYKLIFMNFNYKKFAIYLLIPLLFSCKKDPIIFDTTASKIAFGSCGSHYHELPVFNIVAQHNPDVFIFLGDNIYGDTDDMSVLENKYAQLGEKTSYKNLKKNTAILATWDDHDYGRNDAGKYYEFKKESKEIFLDFFNEPADSERRQHEGIYHSEIYYVNDKKLQIILLDNRTFRSNLNPYNGEVEDDDRYFYTLDYGIHETPDSTLLGEQQWNWLEQELLKPADLRLICSGTQFGIEYNGYEAWANFPHEQQRFLDLIKSTKANGVMFLTGDVHYSEISKIEEPNMYPIYDYTSSGLRSTWEFATPNKNRIKGPIMENHFGLVTIFWKENDPRIVMQTWDVTNTLRFTKTIRLSEISF
tara:strand:+ start:2181 stop:3281 length:1101 start_codon:yes stop_codon:yes gene_type:complete